MFKSKSSKMTCYDMFMTIAPGMLLTLLSVVFNIFMIVAFLTQPGYVAHKILEGALRFLSFAAINFYFGLAAYGLLTVLSEWRRIRATPLRKLMYIWVFPLFMATYLPIAIVALLSKVEWKPIRHFSSGNADLTARAKGS
jgi:hypothetical protein